VTVEARNLSVTKFGETLRAFRQASNDPDRLNRRLTQERLGELIGHEMDDLGFSGAAISDWERGESKINVQDRNVSIALIQVLHGCGGLRTLDDAEQLLAAGNYRALNPDERKEIFQENPPDLSAPVASVEPSQSNPTLQSMIGAIFFQSPQEFQTALEQAREGPSPAWPRVLVAFFRRFSDRLSASRVLKFILWIWVWLFAWVLIMPSLRWPFSNRDEALLAVVIYAAGAIIIPALIGVLTNTKDNEFWREKHSVSELNLRLYIHQGASIGFHIGYFFVFMIGLLRYNLGVSSRSWLEIAAAAFLIILGYAGARLVPYNLLSAYKQLRLKDGRIFFVFFLVGPAWGYFFLGSYDILLTKALGVFIVLSSITILLVMMALRYRQSGTTVIPVYWWVIFWGFIVICQILAFLIK